jgi:WD repeat-containing protein 61
MPYQVYKTIKDAHDDGIWSVSWSKKTNKIVTGGIDDTVRVWNSDSLSQLHTLQGHQLGVISVDISQNGQLACSTSLDGQLRIWDIGSHSLIRSVDAGPVEAWVNF